MKAVAAAICVWWYILTIVVVTPSLAVEVIATADDCGQTLGYFGSVGFEIEKGLTNIKCYSNFLTRLRNKIEAPGVRICGLPTTQNLPSTNTDFITIDLKISNTEWVSVGIDPKDLYVWGYQDKVNGQLRSNFLNDATQRARDHLFPNAVISRTTNFGGNYNSLVRYSNVNITSLSLSMYKLRESIQDVYGKPSNELNTPKEAEFFMRVVQMVSEAARFKFIEKAIVDGDTSKDTKYKLAGYLNDWSKISKAIYKANSVTVNPCTTFQETLVVGNLEYKVYFDKVNDVKFEMAILLYTDVTIATTPNHDEDDDRFNLLRRRPFLKSAVVM
ncbi:hypothetical protein SOVF_149240 [Spinacia oleracea]|uniref:rRNA N-glycosylase n=1 Tax=Spinacia oleracea TaxID=3562 RepID=A0A9R0I3E8_SPIOL|nr:antiviral protein MAP-like isoform X1 [Spinacia oleracea]KNA09904.1 hypothetical protein SOVF_149240 [Spinacia oleracea]